MEGSNNNEQIMTTRYRFPMSNIDHNTDHSGYIECSTQSCRTCSAFALGDCIALCCCPFSVVNLLAFSLLKAPYLISRRMLKTLKKKKGLLHKRSNSCESGDISVGDIVVGYNVKGFERKSLGEYKSVNTSGRLSAKVDPDQVWMDLYQVGQWGFGRVSFSANPIGRNSFGKDVVVYQSLKELKSKDDVYL